MDLVEGKAQSANPFVPQYAEVNLPSYILAPGLAAAYVVEKNFVSRWYDRYVPFVATRRLLTMFRREMGIYG